MACSADQFAEYLVTALGGVNPTRSTMYEDENEAGPSTPPRRNHVRESAPSPDDCATRDPRRRIHEPVTMTHEKNGERDGEGREASRIDGAETDEEDDEDEDYESDEGEEDDEGEQSNFQVQNAATHLSADDSQKRLPEPAVLRIFPDGKGEFVGHRMNTAVDSASHQGEDEASFENVVVSKDKGKGVERKCLSSSSSPSIHPVDERSSNGGDDAPDSTSSQDRGLDHNEDQADVSASSDTESKTEYEALHELIFDCPAPSSPSMPTKNPEGPLADHDSCETTDNTADAAMDNGSSPSAFHDLGLRDNDAMDFTFSAPPPTYEEHPINSPDSPNSIFIYKYAPSIPDVPPCDPRLRTRRQPPTRPPNPLLHLHPRMRFFVGATACRCYLYRYNPLSPPSSLRDKRRQTARRLAGGREGFAERTNGYANRCPQARPRWSQDGRCSCMLRPRPRTRVLWDVPVSVGSVDLEIDDADMYDDAEACTNNDMDIEPRSPSDEKMSDEIECPQFAAPLAPPSIEATLEESFLEDQEIKADVTDAAETSKPTDESSGGELETQDSGAKAVPSADEATVTSNGSAFTSHDLQADAEISDKLDPENDSKDTFSVESLETPAGHTDGAESVSAQLDLDFDWDMLRKYASLELRTSIQDPTGFPWDDLLETVLQTVLERSLEFVDPHTLPLQRYGHKIPCEPSLKLESQAHPATLSPSSRSASLTSRIEVIARHPQQADKARSGMFYRTLSEIRSKLAAPLRFSAVPSPTTPIRTKSLLFRSWSEELTKKLAVSISPHRLCIWQST